MRVNKKAMLITTLVCLLPILYGITVYNKLPDLVPTHWNMAGEANGFSSKAFAVFGLPAFLAVVNIICHIGYAADPRKTGQPKKLVGFVYLIIPAISLIFVPVSLLKARGIDINIGIIVSVLLGVLFFIIGNYLPKCKQNYTMGIKLPWTLNSEENWNKTHRLAGYIWMLGGIIIAICGFLDIMQAFFPIIVVLVLVPTVYSYLLNKKGI